MAAARIVAGSAAIHTPTYGTKRINPAITPNSSAPGRPITASPRLNTAPTQTLTHSCARK